MTASKRRAAARDGLREKMNTPDARRAEIAHNAALKRHYAIGTRVRRLKTGREGTIVWYGRDKVRRVMGQGLVRVGVKWDGNERANFIGTGGIVRIDGLTLEDAKARRTTPARQFVVRSTTGMGGPPLTGGLLHGDRTLGDDYLTDDEFERIGAQVREHKAGVLIHELEPGRINGVRERDNAWVEAKRLAKLDRTGRNPGLGTILFIGLDGEARVVS
jgi:hypothetical protein